jgi:uncharacterized repeat protein (TIGR01451 family)
VQLENHKKQIKVLLTALLFSIFISNVAFAGGANADLGITVTDNVTAASPGGSLTYEIIVNNFGPDDITDAAITDTFPADLTCSTTCSASGTSSCTTGPFAGNINDTGATVNLGETLTYTSVCSIDIAAVGTLSNTASVSSAILDTVPGNNSSTDADTVLASVPTLTITSYNPNPAYPGFTINIVFDLVVSGPGTPTGTVTITDGVNSCIATLPATSCGIVYSSTGTYDLTASYSGDANFTSASSAVFSLGVVDVPIIPVLNKYTLLLLVSLLLVFAFYNSSIRRIKK